MRRKSTTLVKTCLPYVCGITKNYTLRQSNKTVQRVRGYLTAKREEPTEVICTSLGEDPAIVFHLHVVSPHVNRRLEDMVEHGQALVAQGSGRCGYPDALYTYVQTGEGVDDLPFVTFQTPAALHTMFSLFTEKSKRNKVLFRSSELPELHKGPQPVGLFRRVNYDDPIPVEVAFAQDCEMGVLNIVSRDAALKYLELLYEGLKAIDDGVEDLSNFLNLDKTGTHQDFINAFMAKLEEDSVHPVIINAVKKDLEDMLKKKHTTLTVAAKTADLLEDKSLSERLLSLRDGLGMKSPAGQQLLELRLYESHSSRHTDTRKHT